MITWLQREGKLVVILLTYLTLAVAHTIILPLSRGEDEYANFRYIQFIAEHGRLPVNYEERAEARYKSDWPALYHLIIAKLAGWANREGPPQIKAINDEPQRKLVKDILRPTWILHTEDELPPYQGEILMWYLGRLFTTFIGMGTLIVTYYVVLEMCPEYRKLALSVVAFWAAMPRFLFSNAVLSEDSLLGLIMSIFLYVLVRIIKGQDGIWSHLALGGLTGLAVTAKYSAVLVPVEIMIIYIFLARQRGWSWERWLVRMGLTAVATVVAASWWFIFIERYFNEIEELGLIAGLVKPVLASGVDPSMQKAATFLTAGAISRSSPATNVIYHPPLELAIDFIKTFWSGQAVEQLSKYHLFQPYLHLAMTFVALLSLVGLWRIWQANKRNDRTWLAVLVLHSAIITPIIILRFLTQDDPGWAAQGRHLLFPAIPAIGALLIWGWNATPLTIGRAKLTQIVIGVLLIWSVASQIIFPLTIYPVRAPVRTVREALNQVSNRLNIQFGDTIQIVGFEANLHPASASLELTLLWQALGRVDEDYLIAVNVLDATGNLQRQLIRHFGDGVYPSRVWDPGDIIRDDIGLPLLGLPAGRYQLQVSLRGADRALGTDRSTMIALTSLTIGKFADQSPTQKLKMYVGNEEIISGFDLWRNESIVRGNPEYHYLSSIPIVWHGKIREDIDIHLKLIEPNGRIWLPEQEMGQLSTFMVGPGWGSGEYTLRFEAWQNGELVTTRDSVSLFKVRNKQRLVEPPAMMRQIDANFANRVMLVGYDVPARRVKAGESISLILYWRGLRTMSQNFVFFTDLIDSNQKSWGKVERWPRDNYPTLLWAPGELVVDAYEVPIDPNIPDGVYNLQTGLYLPVGESPILLPLVQNSQISKVTSVNLGLIKVGGPPSGLVLKSHEITPQYSLSVKLGEPPIILLRGYDQFQENDMLQLTLYWESLAQTPIDWTTFVHLRSHKGEIITQKDGPTGSSFYPTSLWAAGEIVADEVLLPIDNLPASDYDLFVGLYDLATGTRLSVPANAANEISLGKTK